MVLLILILILILILWGAPRQGGNILGARGDPGRRCQQKLVITGPSVNNFPIFPGNSRPKPIFGKKCELELGMSISKSATRVTRGMENYSDGT